MTDRNIYALFVGIDRYVSPVPALDGCVNDMRAMRDYLVRQSEREGYGLEMQILENEDATRANVVGMFETHLCKATENDIAFFYYSGHGSQEPAHEVFWEIEPDRKNETIVCWDSRSPDGMDLADKELATLLDLVAQKNPHLVVVMDCCNSGSGTRSLADPHEDDAEPVFKSRNTPISEKTRALDTYILPRNLDSERGVLSTSGSQEIIVPLSRHIALSAAHSFELAKETYLGGSPRGVFTYSLIEVLDKATGPVSYNDIMRRVRNLVTQRTYDQVPQMYAQETDDMDLLFLEGLTTRKSNYYQLSSSENSGWSIDGGAVHGIMAPDSSGDTTILTVFPDGSDAEYMADLNNAIGKIAVREVLSGTSNVDPMDGLALDTTEAYRAKVYSMPINPKKVCIRGGDQNGIDLAIDALTRNEDAAIYLVREDDRTRTDFNVIAKSGLGYVITRVTDRDDQPMVEQILGFSEESARKAIDNLLHIARFERTLELSNSGSSIFSEAVQVHLSDPSGNAIMPGPDGIHFYYRKANGPAALPRFKMKLVNTSGQRLFCSLLYMSSQFEVNPGLLPQGGIWLDPGGEAAVIGGKEFAANVADEWVAFGIDTVTEVFKLIVCTTEFDPTLFRLNKLGLPNPRFRSTEKKGQNTRSLMFADFSSSPSDDWNATELNIRITREDPELG